jgi:hypothetical protein
MGEVRKRGSEGKEMTYEVPVLHFEVALGKVEVDGELHLVDLLQVLGRQVKEFGYERETDRERKSQRVREGGEEEKSPAWDKAFW